MQLEVPENLKTKCPALIVGDTSEQLSMGRLLKEDIELMGIYNECAMRHDKLVEAIDVYIEHQNKSPSTKK